MTLNVEIPGHRPEVVHVDRDKLHAWTVEHPGAVVLHAVPDEPEPVEPWHLSGDGTP